MYKFAHDKKILYKITWRW